MSYIKDRIDEFEMEEAYSKPKGDIYIVFDVRISQ